MRAIITWHSVDPSGSPISVPQEVFRRQLAWLASGHVRVVSVPELRALSDTTNAAALTFDDGFANFATEAMPLLHERGLPATLFIVTDHVGSDNRCKRQPEHNETNQSQDVGNMHVTVNTRHSLLLAQSWQKSIILYYTSRQPASPSNGTNRHPPSERTSGPQGAR